MVSQRWAGNTPLVGLHLAEAWSPREIRVSTKLLGCFLQIPASLRGSINSPNAMAQVQASCRPALALEIASTAEAARLFRFLRRLSPFTASLLLPLPKKERRISAKIVGNAGQRNAISLANEDRSSNGQQKSLRKVRRGTVQVKILVLMKFRYNMSFNLIRNKKRYEVEPVKLVKSTPSS